MAEVGEVESLGGPANNQRLNALLRYWLEKRAGRAMPRRRDIDPVEIPRVLPIVLLASALEPVPVIRLMGTEATNFYGEETRGWTVDRFNWGSFTPTWHNAFETVRLAKTPIAAGGVFAGKNGPNLADLILAPLSENDQDISHIVGALSVNVSWEVGQASGARPDHYIRPITQDSVPFFSIEPKPVPRRIIGCSGWPIAVLT